MKTIFKIGVILTFIILGIYLVSAIEFVPQGSINLKNIFNITNVPFINTINFTLFYNNFISSNSTINSKVDSVNSSLLSINTTLQTNIDSANSRINSVNSSLVSINSTLDTKIDNVNLTTYNWVEATFLKIVNMFTKSEITGMISGNRTASETTLRAELQGNRTEIETNTNNAISGNRTQIESNTNSAISGNVSNLNTAITGNASAIRTDINNNVTQVNTNILNNWTDLETRKLNYTDQRFNETTYINNIVTNNNASWSSTYNSTYESNISSVSSRIDVLNGTIISSNETARVNALNSTIINSNSSWTTTYNSTYHGLINNASYLSTYNSTYATWAYNQTTPANSYTDTQVNKSFNQSATDILYAPNTTSGIQSLINSTGVYSTYNATYSGSVNNASYLSTYNVTYHNYVVTNYTNKSDFWDNMNTINSTQIQDNSGVLNILESWLTTFFNTLFGTKTTDDLTQGTTNKYDNRSWNETKSLDLHYTKSQTFNNSANIDTNYNISANYFKGNLDWTNLTNYPAGCPDGFYLTQLEDSVTCTAVHGNITIENTVVTNLNVTKNITMINNGSICLDPICLHYIYENSTGAVIIE